MFNIDYKDKRGLTLIEMIIGIAILGIIILAFLSLFTMGYYTIHRTDAKTEMKYAAQDILENLKAYEKDDEATLLGESVSDIVVDLDSVGIVNLYNSDYDVTITKENVPDTATERNLWKVTLTIASKRVQKVKPNEIIIDSYMVEPEI